MLISVLDLIHLKIYFKVYKSKLVLIHYSLFHTVEEKDLCANKKCGDVCASSLEMLMLFEKRMRHCQPDGSCGYDAAPQCEKGDFCCRYFNIKILVIRVAPYSTFH